jgi:hypothetical protein
MKTHIFLLVFLTFLTSCNKKENCQDILLTVEHLDCENLKYSMDIDLNNNYTYIRSKEEYDAMVTGTCHPEIDFSNWDLIIGKQASGNENDTIYYNYRRTCIENRLTLNIEIVQSDLTRPDNITYHALIPKLGDEETIFVNIYSH